MSILPHALSHSLSLTLSPSLSQSVPLSLSHPLCPVLLKETTNNINDRHEGLHKRLYNSVTHLIRHHFNCSVCDRRRHNDISTADSAREERMRRMTNMKRGGGLLDWGRVVHFSYAVG